LADTWEEFDDNYCKHGYYRGVECPDCDSSSPVGVFIENNDPGDETEHNDQK
jgi:hypothetical protein